MINVDVSATAFYEDCRLPEMAAKILNRRSENDLRRGLQDRDVQKLERALKGLKVQVNHRRIQSKFKILRLTTSPADQTRFTLEDGTEITVAQYFQHQYNLRLSFPGLPCVITRRRNQDNYFPMEVCELVPGQRFMKKLNEKQTAEMIKFTCQRPSVRANKIMDGFNLLQYKNNPYMQQFGVNVNPEMSIVDARVLDTPKISYSLTEPDSTFAPQGGAWNLRGKKVAVGATLSSWSVVNFSPGTVNMQHIQRFIRELCQTFIDTGLVSISNHNSLYMEVKFVLIFSL